METAVILCEGLFGKPLGKTAAGLVRRSYRFKIVGVIDSSSPKGDAGEILDGVSRNIPIFSSISEMMSTSDTTPDFLIIGVATMGGKLPESFRKPIAEALNAGISVISGLHVRLAEDEEFSSIAKKTGATIEDIRKEPAFDRLKYFRNLAKDLPCKRIAVLGTDAAIGKRTTALELTEALNSMEIRTVFVATGQTGMLQCPGYGIPVDAIRGDFVVGELESEIVRAFEKEHPEVIIIEGQGSLSHPAYVTGSRAIVSAASPNGIVLQHAPMRKIRTFHEEELGLPMPDIDSEIELIKAYARCPLIGITINHHGMTRDEVRDIIREYEAHYQVPCIDVLWFGAAPIAKKIAIQFGLPR